MFAGEVVDISPPSPLLLRYFRRFLCQSDFFIIIFAAISPSQVPYPRHPRAKYEKEKNDHARANSDSAADDEVDETT